MKLILAFIYKTFTSLMSQLIYFMMKILFTFHVENSLLFKNKDFCIEKVAYLWLIMFFFIKSKRPAANNVSYLESNANEFQVVHYQKFTIYSVLKNFRDAV